MNRNILLGIIGVTLVVSIVFLVSFEKRAKTKDTIVEIGKCIAVNKSEIASFPKISCKSNKIYAEIPVALYLQKYKVSTNKGKIVITIYGKNPRIACIREVNILLLKNIKQIIFKRTTDMNTEAYLKIDVKKCIAYQTCSR